jgi:hypothetical protein
MMPAAANPQRTIDELVRAAKALDAEIKQETERFQDKMEPLRVALGLILKEAKERKPDGITWPAFVKKHFNFSRSYADQLISIAEHRTTVAETNARAAKGMRELRARRNTVNVTATTSPVLEIPHTDTEIAGTTEIAATTEITGTKIVATEITGTEIAGTEIADKPKDGSKADDDYQDYQNWLSQSDYRYPVQVFRRLDSLVRHWPDCDWPVIIKTIGPGKFREMVNTLKVALDQYDQAKADRAEAARADHAEAQAQMRRVH